MISTGVSHQLFTSLFPRKRIKTYSPLRKQFMGVVEGRFGKCCVPLKKFWLCYGRRNKINPRPPLSWKFVELPQRGLVCRSTNKMVRLEESRLFWPLGFFPATNRLQVFMFLLLRRCMSVKSRLPFISKTPGSKAWMFKTTFKLLGGQNSLTNSLHCYLECYRRWRKTLEES